MSLPDQPISSFKHIPSARLLGGPLLVLAIGLISALVWWNHAESRNRVIVRQAFAAQTADLQEQLFDRIDSYVRGLHGMRGAIAAAGGETASRVSMQAFYQSRDWEKEYPGSRGIGFIRRVPPDRQQAFIARMRREGLADFAINDLSPHQGEHFVIQFIEPLERNRKALGLDIASEEQRRTAAQLAAQSGAATLTAPLTLLHTTENSLHGFLLLLPVYREYHSGRAAGEKGEAYGWVFSPLLIDEVLAGIDRESYAFTLADVSSAQPPSVFFESAWSNSSSLDRLEKRVELDVLGRTWELDSHANEYFIRQLNLSDPAREAGLVLLVFVLLAGWLFAYRQGAQRKLQHMVSAQLGDAAPEAMLVADEAGVITHVNQRLTSMFGYAQQELLGSKVEILLPENIRQRHVADRSHYNRSPRAMGGGRYLEARRKDGSVFPVEVSLGPLQVGDKRLTIAMAVDITARLQMENALRDSEARWSFALEGSGDGVWEWDLQTGAVTLSKAGAAMFGYTAEEAAIGTIADWYARLSSQDRERWEDVLRNLFKRQDEKFLIEYRVRCKDGSEKWVLTRGMVAARNADGKVARMIGVHTDISERKSAEEKLRATSALLDSIIENVPNMVFLKRAEDLRFEFFNRAGERLLGVKREALLGRNDYDFFPREQADFFTTKDREVLRQEGVMDIPEESIDTPQGSRMLHTQKLTIRDGRRRRRGRRVGLGHRERRDAIVRAL
ncbi:MAG: PAS domain S-box protein [Nitrosomonadales bacterium]|nr:PAS domain S-box protein [Nitrosomonadales bacterium]